MQIRSTHLALAGLAAAVALTGCSSKKRSNSTSTTTAPTTSNTGTTAPTNTNTNTTPPTGTTNPGSTGSQAGGGTTTPGGGNTSSGSATTGAGSGGFQGGTGRFVDATAWLPDTQERDYGADAADLDGDGDVDVAIAVNNGASRVLFNAGNRFVTRAGAFPSTVMAATDVRILDVDGDQDFDLLFSANFEPVRVFLNDGQGVFTLGQEFNTQNDCYTYNVALGDADGDGDEDAFLVNAGQSTPSQGQNKLFLNDGAGQFVEAPTGWIPAAADDSLDATFLDVDGDGDRDIFVANFGTPHSLLINDGTGRFANRADIWLPPALTRYGTAIAQGDMDQDGKTDLFVANEGAPGAGTPPPGEKNTLLLQGVGRFTDESANRVPADAYASFAVRLVDVNGDGWLDVFVSNLRAPQRHYRNVAGVLVDASGNLPSVSQTPANSLGLTIGDFNGDRAPDVLYTRRGEKPLLFLNTP